jgi:hypothetical protein
MFWEHFAVTIQSFAHTFSTESISPATAPSEEIINVQVAYLLIDAFM